MGAHSDYTPSTPPEQPAQTRQHLAAQAIFGPRTDFGFHDARSLIGFLALGISAGVIGLLFEATMKKAARVFDGVRLRQLPVVDGDQVGAPIGLLRRSDALIAFDQIAPQEEQPATSEATATTKGAAARAGDEGRA